MFTIAGIVAVAGAAILFFVMTMTEKEDLIFIPFILMFLGVVFLIVASVVRSKEKKERFDENIRQQMTYNPKPYNSDPFFTVDPFADAFSPDPAPEKKTEEKSAKSDKFCSNCGAPRVSGDKFCPFCGQKYE